MLAHDGAPRPNIASAELSPCHPNRCSSATNQASQSPNQRPLVRIGLLVTKEVSSLLAAGLEKGNRYSLGSTTDGEGSDENQRRSIWRLERPALTKASIVAQDAQAQHLARKACKSASRKGLKGNRGAF